MPNTCYLHVGLTKTGSTALQQACTDHRDTLAENGLLYPNPAPAINHTFLAPYLSDAPFQMRRARYRGGRADLLKKDAERFGKRLRRAVKKNDGKDIILSSEVFSTAPPPVYRKIQRFCRRAADRLVVVIYVRHPFDRAVSRLQQVVKSGQPAIDPLTAEHSLPRLITRLSADLPKEDVILRPFAADQLIGGDVVQDFFHAIGHEALASRISAERTNESLSFEAFQLAEALGAALPDEQGMNKRRAAGMQKILQQIGGAKFGVSAETLAASEAAYAGTLAELEAKFGLRFNAPTTRISAPVWGEETCRDIALLLNDLKAENDRLRKRLARIEASRDA